MSNRYKGGVISATPPTLVAGAGASGTWTLEQQMQATAAGLWPVNGPFYVEDVFSTYLYTGTGAAQTITNGINLSGKGGLVWLKNRSGANDHGLFDTIRGAGYRIVSNLTDAENFSLNYISSFGSTGFSLGAPSSSTNASGNNYASWTFREQPKFFDVVTYTGTGAVQTIAHNLGSAPGCIIVKTLSTPGNDWGVYHRSLGATYKLNLNATSAAALSTGYWNNTAPTSTEFTVATSGITNQAGQTYVAYLFAHDAGGFGATGTDNVISCGSFTTDGSGYGSVTLGYEPQWILMKDTQSSSIYDNWYVIDNMRGFLANGNANELYANKSDAENANVQRAAPTATGFIPQGLNASKTYIYIAIRRGPMKVPTSGTSVFVPYAYTGNGSATRDYSAIGMVTDMNWTSCRSNDVSVSPIESSRLQGNTVRLQISSTQGEDSGTYGLTWNAYQNGVQGNSVFGGGDGWNTNAYTYIGWNFRRASGFFDEVCYTGTGSSTTQSHNLGAVPEMMVIRRRTGSGYLWVTYVASQGNTKFAYLNSDQAFATDSYLASTTPTSSVFTIGTNGDVNASGATYIAYLFATCAGVSKVGSYTGTGTTLQVNCGFTGGSRFVMIKRADSTGGWYVWDSARGIVSGNDPYLLLNSTAAEVTNTDYVDTYSAGFEISSTAPAAINANGGTFIFLAIA